MAVNKGQGVISPIQADLATKNRLKKNVLAMTGSTSETINIHL